MKSLNQIQKATLAVLIALLPSFFLTGFTNIFEAPKLIFLTVLLSLSLIFFAVRLALEGKGVFKVSNLDLPILVLTATFVVSGLLKTPNKMEAFFVPGVVTGVIAGFLLYLFTKNQFSENKNQLSAIIFSSGILVSILSIFAFLGVFTKIPQLPDFMKAVTFSSVGGKLPEVILLVALLPLGISLALKEKDLIKRVFYMTALAISALAIVLGISQILPGKSNAPLLVSFATSWSIAVDTLKISPLWGVGPGNYLTAFSRFLPLDYNSTPFWAVRFSSARSFFLTLVTEVGLIGALAFTVIVFSSVKSVYTKMLSKKNIGEGMSLILLTLALLLFPANLTLMTIFFLLLALSTQTRDFHINLSATSFKKEGQYASKMPSIAISLLIIAGVIALYFFGAKALKAEFMYKEALNGIAKNDGKVAYDSLRDAINVNPTVDRYHTTYAQVNLALASAIAQKESPTEEDRKVVAQLVQQAIREGKATVTLNAERATNWEVLAQIYRSIMPFAEGADRFAVQTYSQAIALDPINPNLRIALGGTYFALGRFDEAIEAFKLAVLAKPDFANAHYNLALAYREKKDFDSAINEMKTVLSLVQINSNDYNLAQTELANLEKNKSAAAGETDNLTPPQELPESNITPPLTLPDDSTPPDQP